MNVNLFAFYVPRRQAMLQQKQMRDDHYFLKGVGRGRVSPSQQKSCKESHGEKNEQVLFTYFLGAMSNFWAIAHERKSFTTKRGETFAQEIAQHLPPPSSLKNIIVYP